MKKYCVKEGKHDFKPFDWPKIVRVKKIDHLLIECRFSLSCIYDFEGDLDQLDWNKLPGGSLYLWWNALDHVLPGWRCAPSGLLEMTAYTNSRKNGRQIGNGKQKVMLTLDPRQELEFKCKITPYDNGQRWKYQFLKNGKVSPNQAIHDLGKPMKWLRTTGAWFGGANNSAGPYGGTAPHHMCLFTKITVVKK